MAQVLSRGEIPTLESTQYVYHALLHNHLMCLNRDYDLSQFMMATLKFSASQVIHWWAGYAVF